jgi:hypothetical protein
MGGDWICRDAIRTGDNEHSCGSRSGDDGEVITLRITPDTRLDNKGVDELARTLCLYTSPLERFKGKRIQRPSFLSFETVLEKGNTRFYVSVPPQHEALAKKAIETTWSKATVERVDDPFKQSPTLISTIELDRHYMFALRVDKRKAGALLSVLETLRNLEQDEKVYIQTIGVPAPKDWYISAAEAYERFKRGEFPQKLQFNKKTATRTSLKVLTHTVYGAASVMSEFLAGEPLEKLKLDEGQRALILRDGSLSTATLNKTKGDAFEFCMRIGVVSKDNERANAIMRMVSMAYRDLDGDNMLTSTIVNPQRGLKRMKERRMNVLATKDYLSIPEFSRLCTLPSKEQQELYKIPNISQMETDVSVSLLKKGIKIGRVAYKGKEQAVYYPTNNWDELCLPRVVTGKMGQGKSSYSINLVIESVKNGFGALVIDPAKRETGNEIELDLPKEQIIRFDLGKIPIGLDWREVEHSNKAKNRLANTILSFFDMSNAEAGAQTTRYIRAAVMGMKTGRLSEIMRIFEDESYRQEIISKMPESIHKTTLSTFSNESEKRRNQILSPIYNRLDIILGDEYLNECMHEESGIDMVELMNQQKAIIIDVPKKELGGEVVDLIINILSSKIDLAMTLRDEENMKPFFVIFDELHQMQKSTTIWKAAAVESRKWRVAYNFIFHTMEQVPKELTEIIKSAGPHYVFYNSSKKTFNEFKEELAPFTVEDFIKLKRFHAINVINADNEVKKPFISEMSPPPSIRKSLR